MNKFQLRQKINTANPIVKEDYIEQKCLQKEVLDLGCIRHSAEYALKDQSWLHRRLKSVAKTIVGLDYLPMEISKLRENGYDIIFGDVTKPLDLKLRFDIIVAGDLIEHLTNFDGFFNNCDRLLKPDGELIITTPNPFYVGEFHFVTFKKNYLINPEHTCWIDPQALSQLAIRFGYEIQEVRFIKNPWNLKDIILESENHEYDILNGKWLNDSIKFKVFRKLAGGIFNLFYLPYRFITRSRSDLVRYSDYLAILRKTTP